MPSTRQYLSRTLSNVSIDRDSVSESSATSAAGLDEDSGWAATPLGEAPTVAARVPQSALEPAVPAAESSRPGPPAGSYLQRRRRVKLQARKVRRVIRYIEPWSVLKISVIFYICVWLILMLAGVLLWSVVVSSGIVDKVENFIVEVLGLDSFEFNAGLIFRGYALGGLVLVVAGTALNVLFCVLFNLISDLVGGLRVTVLEEETARFRPTRRRATRRGAKRGSGHRS